MTAVALTITIQRTAEDVFSVLTHLENASKWSRAIEEQLITPGPIGVGSRRRAIVPTFAGRTSQNVIEVTEFDPNRRMVMRGVSGFPFPVRISVDLQPVAGGTRIDWVTDMEPHGFLRPIGPLVAAAYRSAFRRDLARLKVMMESGQL